MIKSIFQKSSIKNYEREQYINVKGFQLRVKAYNILKKHYDTSSLGFEILLRHSQDVTRKAVKIASAMKNVDVDFVAEASMLHDIGVYLTHAPDIGCHGDMPYICHGYLGREILEKEGLPRHALVSERHTGTGLTKDDIISNDLPIPHRDMLPTSIEEIIICYSDKFFSKNPKQFGQEKSYDKVLKEMAKFGADNAERFRQWHLMLSGEFHASQV